MIRIALRKIFNFIWHSSNVIGFKLFLLKNSQRKIAVFDIDNTIADTWPSFFEVWSDERKRLRSLKSHEKMVEIAKNLQVSGYSICFMSARSIRYYTLTKDWLTKNGFSNFNYILVASPAEKIILLGMSKVEIEFYDDLSYGHETGNVQYYKNQIFDLKNLKNIRHYGHEYINKIIKDDFEKS